MSDTANSADPSRSKALAWLASSEREDEIRQLVAPFVDAAAVLTTFSLKTLQPTDPRANENRADALIELTNFARPVEDSDVDCWQLEEPARRSSLRRLANRNAMRSARAANSAGTPDPLQQGIDLLIKFETPPPISRLSLDQLLGLERAIGWFQGILPGLPGRADLEARIERERQLAPMRKIADEDFVDREDYLAKLNDYVGVLPAGTVWRGLGRGIKYVSYLITQRPPLHLFGPGGIGKSALLARFVLNHADPSSAQPLPFVYLDFDRAALNPRDPQTLLVDAIRQLLIQFPWVDGALAQLGDEARERGARVEYVEVAKSSHYFNNDRLVTRFCRLLELVAERNDQPVLLVLDTLEEAEFQGLSAMLVTWRLLSDLLERVDRLRIVTAGRSALSSDLSREPLELRGLPTEAAAQLIVKRTARIEGGPISIEDANRIVALVGTVPLSLALAARVVIKEGLAGLRDTVGRRRIFSSIKAEQQQGMLYQRILKHVRAHDEQLEKVANPGLILRRITPQIIEKVLAQPCRLQLNDQYQAKMIFDALTRETGLVDAYREPGAVWHLPAVRRIMLPELRATLGDLARTIHQAAANYYRDGKSPVEKAEEIYHRLWLSAEPAELDKLWQPEFEAHLRSAYDELEPVGKIWLADKLGIELSAELRAQADLAVWERQAEQRARTLTSNGLLKQALEALRERERSGAPSALYALEADVLKLLGWFDQAHHVLNEGLAAAQQAGDKAATLPLLLREGFLLEGERSYVGAFSYIAQALGLALELASPMDVLSAGIATLRLDRKLRREGNLHASEHEAREAGVLLQHRDFFQRAESLRDHLLQSLEDEQVRTELRARPALLQEAAAELGGFDNSLLADAVAVLGISADDQIALNRYASRHSPETSDQASLSALRSRGTSRGSGRLASELVPAYSEFFVERFARAVDESLERRVAADENSTVGDPSLDTGQLAQLATLVANDFARDEINLLAEDYVEVSLDSIASPQAPLESQVKDLLDYAQKSGSLGSLVAHIARSRPDDDRLSGIAGDFDTKTLL